MISSSRNPLIQRTRKLLKRGLRNAAREFLVEGSIAVEEGLSAKAPMRMVLATPNAMREDGITASLERAGVQLIEVSEAVMRSVSATTSPPGILGICGFVDVAAEDLAEGGLNLPVVLAEVRDPGNAGTILRACRAVGVDGVFVAAGTVDIYNPKLVRASAGAVFHVPIAREVQTPWILKQLEAAGVKRVAAEPRGNVVYDQVDMTDPTAIVLGNEAWGLPDAINQMVDVRAFIPMKGSTESLNVGVAGAILLFEAARQRRNR